MLMKVSRHAGKHSFIAFRTNAAQPAEQRQADYAK